MQDVGLSTTSTVAAGLGDRIKRMFAAVHESVAGPTRTTWAVKQVVGYLGYSGRDADVVVTAALDLYCRKSPWHPADTQQSNHRSRLIDSRRDRPRAPCSANRRQRAGERT
jgi:hypothetical protein